MSSLIATQHPEDIRAALRKRYGSVRAFQREHGLPDTGVADVLRGRVSHRVTEAIERVLHDQISESKFLDHSSRVA